MRAREAEDLIADLLTGNNKSPGLEKNFNDAQLIGLRRSRPIYRRKIRQKELVDQRRVLFSCRRVVSLLMYPIEAMANIFRL